MKQFMSIFEEKPKECNAKELVEEFKKKGRESMKNLITLRDEIVHQLVGYKNIPNINSRILLEDK